jgi:hypothetical protein
MRFGCRFQCEFAALQSTAATLKAQLEQHMKATATLRANIGALEAKVTEALSKKETLKARAMSAQVSPAFQHVPLSVLIPSYGLPARLACDLACCASLRCALS